MTDPVQFKCDPKRDLLLERVVDVPCERVWSAWTTPEHLIKWFTPKPWQTVDCEIDLRPGGIFRTTMRSPEGQEFPNSGCYLEVTPLRRLIFTSVLLPGYRPSKASADDLAFTAVITLTPQGKSSTKYSALAIHADASDSKRHADMGFQDGWGKALDQLVDVARAMA